MHGRTAVIALNAACLLALWCAAHLLHAQGGAVHQVHTAGDQTTFHIGERIPLELRFTAPAEAKLTLITGSGDRAGSMGYEQLTVDRPSGWADPLKTYFGSSGGFAGSFLSSMANLTPQPTTVPIDLNEWIRFDEAGDYRVTVSSGRVADPAKRRQPSDQENRITAAPLLLHIVPASEAWQAQRLQSIHAVLKTTEANTYNPTEARRGAIADLRFLGSKASIAELADNLRDDRPDMRHASEFGLMGLPRFMRDAAVASLQSRIDDPQFPVCGSLLETVAVLHVRGSDDPKTEWAERGRTRDDAWREILRALPRKQGEARAVTTQTLLGQVPADLDPEAKRQLGAVMAASLSDLPEEKRARELEWNWDALKSPSMLPVLMTSAKLPSTGPRDPTEFYGRRGLKSIALARWYELDPVGATQEIMAQIGSAHPSLTAESLYFLPKEPLPQFEALWAQTFAATNDYQQETVLAGLLVRFGMGAATGAVVGKVQQKLGNWACEPQAATLAYMLKFDPDEAKPLLQRAGDARAATTTRCYSSLFQEVSRFAYGPVLNDVALEALDSPDGRETMDALNYLAAYGRKEDRQPIWEHFVAWHEHWQGKGGALDGDAQMPAEESYLGRAVGENLARALIANQGWLADAALMQRVLGMCVGQQMCTQLQQLAQQAQSHDVTLYRSGNSETFQVAQYSSHSLALFQEKVAQFPKGTRFRLSLTAPRTVAQMTFESEVQKMFEDEGMILVPNIPLNQTRFAER